MLQHVVRMAGSVDEVCFGSLYSPQDRPLVAKHSALLRTEAEGCTALVTEAVAPADMEKCKEAAVVLKQQAAALAEAAQALAVFIEFL